MSIQKFVHAYKRTILTALYVVIGIPMFLIILGFLRIFIFGGVHPLNTFSDSFSPIISKSARHNSISYEQTADFEEGVGAPSGGVWDDSVRTGQEDKKIIKTASLSLIVEDVEVAIANIKGIAESLGGSADNRNIYESGNDRKYGNHRAIIQGKSNRKTMA